MVWVVEERFGLTVGQKPVTTEEALQTPDNGLWRDFGHGAKAACQATRFRRGLCGRNWFYDRL